MRAGGWAGLMLLAAAGAGVAQAGECSGGMPAFGTLGIGEFRCVGGACAVNMRSGDPYAHSFSTEPRLSDVDPDGPGSSVLEDGDVLVAIDGTLITTAEGGRKLGSLRPGQDVKLTLRRGGREIDARVQAESSCELPRLTVTRGGEWEYPQPSGYTYQTTDSTFSRAWVLPDSLGESPYFFANPTGEWSVLPDSTSWARTLYTLSDSTGLSYGIATGPYTVSSGDYLMTTETGFAYGITSGGARPPVEFGVELRCGECGWRGSGHGATFSTAVFPVIESVEKDGPADRAGLLPGDIMYSVGGAPITSPDAGRRLGALKPGESVTLEIRRGDRIVEVEITPRESSTRRQRM